MYYAINQEQTKIHVLTTDMYYLRLYYQPDEATHILTNDYSIYFNAYIPFTSPF
jgi:hypothetical protein